MKNVKILCSNCRFSKIKSSPNVSKYNQRFWLIALQCSLNDNLVDSEISFQPRLLLFDVIWRRQRRWLLLWRLMITRKAVTKKDRNGWFGRSKVKKWTSEGDESNFNRGKISFVHLLITKTMIMQTPQLSIIPKATICEKQTLYCAWADFLNSLYSMNWLKRSSRTPQVTFSTTFSPSHCRFNNNLFWRK